MNYYDETIKKIEKLIKEKEYEEAKRLILNELDIAYVPKDFEEKLYELLQIVKDNSFKETQLSDETIIDYLKSDETHQLIAVNALNKKNLRDYIDLCEKYLCTNSFKNAKALLIESLINQEINHTFKYIDDDRELSFNPSELKPILEDENYKKCLAILQDTYMKEPSLLIMAEQLLYKEAMFMLPETISDDNIDNLVEKIVMFIKDAFAM